MNENHKNVGFMKRSFEWLAGFFSAVPGSLKDHLNQDELIRIAVASVSAGGGIFGVLEMILHSAGILFPAPADAALATAILTMILETRRRLSQGTELAPRSRSRNLAR